VRHVVAPRTGYTFSASARERRVALGGPKFPVAATDPLDRPGLQDAGHAEPVVHDASSQALAQRRDLNRGRTLLPGTKTAKPRRKVFIPDALAVELRAAVVKVGALVEPWGNVCRDLDVA